jgi:hypothetical protein
VLVQSGTPCDCRKKDFFFDFHPHRLAKLQPDSGATTTQSREEKFSRRNRNEFVVGRGILKSYESFRLDWMCVVGAVGRERKEKGLEKQKAAKVLEEQ